MPGVVMPGLPRVRSQAAIPTDLAADASRVIAAVIEASRIAANISLP